MNEADEIGLDSLILSCNQQNLLNDICNRYNQDAEEQINQSEMLTRILKAASTVNSATVNNESSVYTDIREIILQLQYQQLMYPNQYRKSIRILTDKVSRLTAEAEGTVSKPSFRKRVKVDKQTSDNSNNCNSSPDTL